MQRNAFFLLAIAFGLCQCYTTNEAIPFQLEFGTISAAGYLTFTYVHDPDIATKTSTDGQVTATNEEDVATSESTTTIAETSEAEVTDTSPSSMPQETTPAISECEDDGPTLTSWTVNGTAFTTTLTSTETFTMSEEPTTTMYHAPLLTGTQIFPTGTISGTVGGANRWSMHQVTPMPMSEQLAGSGSFVRPGLWVAVLMVSVGQIFICMI